MHHHSAFFHGYKDLNLFYRYWLPDSNPRALLLVVHGLAEHSGRYVNLVDYFVPRGWAVFSFDQRGHGESEGQRGYVTQFEEYLTDLKTFYEIVRRQHPTLKVFLVGHSVGGTVATAYARQYQSGLAGLILSGATFKMADSPSAALLAVARVLSRFVPTMGMRRIDATAVSRDPSVVAAYDSDPLVYRGKISARLGVELVDAMAKIPALAPQIKLPVLIMQGAADCPPRPFGQPDALRVGRFTG